MNGPTAPNALATASQETRQTSVLRRALERLDGERQALLGDNAASVHVSHSAHVNQSRMTDEK